MFFPWRQRSINYGQEVSAGLIVACLIIPQAIGYGLLAGLPPTLALASCVAPLAAYALFGNSRAMAIGPGAIVSLMVGQGVLGLPQEQIALAAQSLAIMVAAILFAIRFLNLGQLVNFIGHPVIKGFTTAAAILIIYKQFNLMLAAPIPETDAWHLNSAIISAVSILILIAIKTLLPSPLGKLGPLFVLIMGMAVIKWLPSLNIANIEIDSLANIFQITLPVHNAVQFYLNLLPSALLIALLVFLESTSVAKTLAKPHQERVRPNQELMGLGSANLASYVFNGYPVSGGLGRSMVNQDAGAQSPLAGVFTAIFVLAFLLLAPNLIAYMAKPILGAIVAVAVWSLIDMRPLYKYWRLHPQDNSIWLASFLGVFILGIELGIALGVATSIIFLLRNAAKPHIAIIGRIPDTQHFRNIKRFNVITYPHLLAIRIDEGLHFANRETVEDYINDALKQHPQTQHLLLVCSAVNIIDSDGIELLESLAHRARKTGITLNLAEVKGPIMDKLHRVKIVELIAPGKVYLSTDEAFKALGEDHEAKPTAPSNE